jgi:hypothetical protein
MESVDVPIDVPSKLMVANSIGERFDITFPVIIALWAKHRFEQKKRTRGSNIV